MNKLPKPKNQRQEVLYELLKNGFITEFTLPIRCFQSIMREFIFIYDIRFLKERKQGLTKHKNVYTYHVHSIREDNKEKAEKLYLELCGNKK